MNKFIFILVVVCLSIELFLGVPGHWFINDLKPCKLVEERENLEGA